MCRFNILIATFKNKLPNAEKFNSGGEKSEERKLSSTRYSYLKNDLSDRNIVCLLSKWFELSQSNLLELNIGMVVFHFK